MAKYSKYASPVKLSPAKEYHLYIHKFFVMSNTINEPAKTVTSNSVIYKGEIVELLGFENRGDEIWLQIKSVNTGNSSTAFINKRHTHIKLLPENVTPAQKVLYDK